MTKLFLALDGLVTSFRKTRDIAYRLDETGLPFGLKFNLDYFLQNGLKNGLASFVDTERDIFVDLKMWNGERTMTDTFKMLEDLGVSYVTVHALGDEQLRKAASKLPGNSKLNVAATTILTHYSEDYCQRHFRRSRAECVEHFTTVAIEAGCHAVVLPGQYLPNIKDDPIQKIVPGIREAGGVSDGRHDVEVTPMDAVLDGADVLVCGSPIMKSDDPVAALRRILTAMGTSC